MLFVAQQLEYVPTRFKTNEMLIESFNETWKVFCFFPENMYTFSNTLDFLNRIIELKEELDYSDEHLLYKTVANFPDKTNKNIEIIRLERILNVRGFTYKFYDSESKSFKIYENIYYNNTEEVNEFKGFNEFYCYLDGNLKNANLYSYDFFNVNLENYNVEGAFIRSSTLIEHKKYNDSYYKENIESSKDYLDLVLSQGNEKIKRPHDIQIRDISDINLNKNDGIYHYISDIHLDHKLANKFPHHATKIEINRYIKKVVSDIVGSKTDKTYYDYLLIAGDVSFNFEISEIFYTELKNRRRFEKIIVVLGNHELWDCNSIECDLEEITDKYRYLFKELEIIFLQNDLLILDGFSTRIINENELELIDVESLKETCLKSSTLILGGIGFSGFNIKFNAESGLYRDVITSLEDDKKQTERFRKNYCKVKDSLSERKVIVLTHTPKSNWSKDNYNSNWIYVNGHTHTNIYINDGNKTICADNQIGYYKETFELKHFKLKRTYDIFKYYKDGKYIITRKQYKDFNRGKFIQMDFKRVFDKIHMIKRKGIYCFLLENKGKLYLLEGGRTHKLLYNYIDYYFDNMIKYSEALKMSTFKFNQALIKLADLVKRIGGEGNIHGCIVDIDFYNHIYLNPYDGSITPYYALSITEKYVYKNINELLLSKRKDLYDNLILSQNNIKDKYLINQESLDIYDEPQLVQETNIYKISNVMKAIQYLTNDNIIRIWDDNVINANYEIKG